MRPIPRYAPRIKPARAPTRCARSSFVAPRPADLLRCLLLIQRRQVFLKLLQFRQIVEDDVWLVGMELQIVLMVSFGRIEPREWNHLGYDRVGERAPLIELRDVVSGHLLLSVVLIEDRRSILSSRIR